MERKLSFLIFVLAIVLVVTGAAMSASKVPTTVAELALYKGADRQQILEQGARKEGSLTFYTTGVLTGAVRPVVDAFQKKYPYIKVNVWRGEDTELFRRIIDEDKAGRSIVDTIGVSQETFNLLEEKLQPFYSPSLPYIDEAAIQKAKGEGALAAGHYETGYGVAYNTKRVTDKDLPKTYQDLLNPRWKGKMVITSTSTAVKWMGTQLVHLGMDHVKRLAEQQFTIQMVSARALLDMIIAGEYALSPAIGDAQVIKSKEAGAPVDWTPLEPVYVALGAIMLAKRSVHPHATLLFIDFDLSKEAGEIYKGTGYNSPRKDIETPKKYKKYYGEGSEEVFNQWNELFNRLFMKK